MVRTSRGAPNAVDAGALDDLDLDGMFAEQGDLLFDGFEMELEGMDDIVGQEKSSPQQKTRRGGPRTKSSNPAIPPEEQGAPKRRKTKRKSKAPAAFEDDDYPDGETTTTRTKKRKIAGSSKKGKMAPEQAPLKKSKKKSNKQQQQQQPTVAAAGQFGNRIKRNSSASGMSQVKKRKSSSQQKESSNTNAQVPPKPEPTYCGLLPSKTMFYPFMEAVPPQPNLKNKKVYPAIDKMFSTFTANMIKPPDALTNEPEYTNNLTMESPIFKLLAETFTSISEKERANFNDDKKVALLKAIPHLRKFIDGYDRVKLVADVYAMLGLLTRQYQFLKTCNDNMHSWCQTEFSPQDYKLTYHQPDKSQQKKAQQAKWKKAYVKVKLKFAGYKEPKGTPLMALLPLSAVSTPLCTTKESSSSGTSKKKKKSSSSSVLQQQQSASFGLERVPKTYAECSPTERRQRILERLSQTARDLTERHPTTSTTAFAYKSAEIPPADEVLSTTKLWEFMDGQGFHKKEIPPELEKMSQLVSQEKLPTLPSTVRGFAGDQVSSNSLFDRLTSLLVEDNDYEEEKVDNDDSSSCSSSSDEESLSFLDEDDDEEEESDDPMEAKQLPVVDLSQLNLEERTFIQLSRAGLLSQQFYPKTNLVLTSNHEELQDAEFSNTLANMATHLGTLEKQNNSRVAFLETCISNMDLPYQKKEDELQNALITKCQNLIKRSKEKAKKSSAKKKDDLNLPW